MSSGPEQDRMINRREAIWRVSAMLGGVALVGGSSLLTACGNDEKRAAAAAGGDVGKFSAEDIAFLDEVADTILPTTKTPGAKAAKTGAFMALMVTDAYDPRDQNAFRDGMKKVDEATEKAHNVGFMKATPQQRLTVLQALDREQKDYMDRRGAAQAARANRMASGASASGAQGGGTTGDTSKPGGQAEADKYLPDQRQENAASPDAGGATAITDDAPPHYFRMMKELALLGYFTSEIGYTQAMRY
jgi:hypothetical protein